MQRQVIEEDADGAGHDDRTEPERDRPANPRDPPGPPTTGARLPPVPHRAPRFVPGVLPLTRRGNPNKIALSLQRGAMDRRTAMRRFMLSLVMLAALLAPQPAFAGQPPVGVVTNFGPNLAAICHMPEGIAIDPTGNLYVSSFAFSPTANICVENRSGQIVDVIRVPAGKAGIASLLGELFEPSQGLYVVDFADGAPTNGRLLRVNVQ